MKVWGGGGDRLRGRDVVRREWQGVLVCDIGAFSIDIVILWTGRKRKVSENSLNDHN